MLRMQHVYLLMIGLSLTGCEKGPRPQSPLSMESSGKPTTVSFAPEYGRKKAPANDPNNAGNPDNGGGNNNAQPAANDVTINKTNLETIKQNINYHVPIVLASTVNQVGDNVPVDEIISRSNFFSRVNANVGLANFNNAFELYREANKKTPQTVEEFVKMLTEGAVNLPDLPKDTSFYIYDPSKTKTDKELKNMEYLKVFEG